MFDHVSLGVRDIARAKLFYDAAFRPIGYECLSQGEKSLGYGSGRVALWLLATDHPVAADPRSGLHLAFVAPNIRSVGEFYVAALAAGGTDNGAPGQRLEYGPGYYAAYVVDPDGYRIEAYCAEEGADAESHAH